MHEQLLLAEVEDGEQGRSAARFELIHFRQGSALMTIMGGDDWPARSH
jgi:hypothetical protein